MKTNKIIHITTGDSDGIGLEITEKAISLLKIPSDITLKVYSSKPFKTKKSNIIFEVNSTPAPYWVVQATKDIIKNGGSLVTGPLSKELIKSCGLPYIGHTEMLASLSKRKDLRMFFIGSRFNVLLATGHIPLVRVEKTLTKQFIKSSLQSALTARILIKSKKPIAVVGLNPHASENGIIGDFDLKLKKEFALQKAAFVGPLVPDVAFQKNHWKKYSLYLALYHDQGLIPFKMIHGQDDGVHVTVGLPFPRFSVDHGTAKDIFNKGIANPTSMRLAIQMAIESAHE